MIVDEKKGKKYNHREKKILLPAAAGGLIAEFLAASVLGFCMNDDPSLFG